MDGGIFLQSILWCSGALSPGLPRISASYNHFLVYHGPILLEDSIRLLLLQDQPFDSLTEVLGVYGDEVGGQCKDLDHVGCQPGGWVQSVSQLALGSEDWHPSQPMSRVGPGLAWFHQACNPGWHADYSAGWYLDSRWRPTYTTPGRDPGPAQGCERLRMCNLILETHQVLAGRSRKAA